MRTTISNLLGPRPVPPLPAPAPPVTTDPALMAMLEDIRRRIVRIETRQARWMTHCNVDLGNTPR